MGTFGKNHLLDAPVQRKDYQHPTVNVGTLELNGKEAITKTRLNTFCSQRPQVTRPEMFALKTGTR